MAEPEIVTLTLYLPKVLRERARVVSKQLRTTAAHLIRDSLDEKVSAIEARFRQEEAYAEAAKERKQRGGKSTEKGPLTPLAPLARPALSREAAVPGTISSTSPLDPLDKVYAEQAANIIATDDDHEKRRRVLIAVKAVRRENPLTHPPEAEILARLEREVVRLLDERDARKAAAPPPRSTMRTADDLVGAIVDVTKAKTRGDVG